MQKKLLILPVSFIFLLQCLPLNAEKIIDDFSSEEVWSDAGDGGAAPEFSISREYAWESKNSLKLVYKNPACGWGNLKKEITMTGNEKTVDFWLYKESSDPEAAMHIWLFEEDGDGWLAQVTEKGKSVGKMEQGWHRINLPIKRFKFEPRGNGEKDISSVNKILLGCNFGDMVVYVSGLKFDAPATTTLADKPVPVESGKPAEEQEKREEVVGKKKERIIGIFKDRVPVSESKHSDPDYFNEILKKAGLATKFLKGEDLADPGILNSDNIEILILPYGSSFPAEATANLKKYLKSGGSFFSTGGYVFDNLYSLATEKAGGNFIENPGFEEGLDCWQVSKPEGVRIDRDSGIKYEGRFSLIFDVPDDIQIGWFGPTQKLEIGEDIKVGDVLKATVFVKTKDVHDGAGAYIAFNFYRENGERITWDQSGVLIGTNDWTEIQLLSRQIPAGTSWIIFNLLLYGHGTAWFDSVKVERSAPGLNTKNGKAGDRLEILSDQIPVFDGGYRFENVVSVSSSPDQFVLDKDISFSGNFSGFGASAMTSTNNDAVFPDTGRRWISLLTGYDRYKRKKATAGALVYNYKGPYKGSAWAYFGINNEDIFNPQSAQKKAQEKIILNVIEAMRRKTFLHDLATNYGCYKQGEEVEIGIKATNQGYEKQAVKINLQVMEFQNNRVVFEETQSAVLEPGESGNYTFVWKDRKFNSDLYRIKAILFTGEKPIDVMETGFAVWNEDVLKNGLEVKWNGPYFTVQEKPFFVCGSNYCGCVFSSQRENPLVLEQDFQQMQDYGLTTLRLLHFGVPGYIPNLAKPSEKILRRLDAMLQIAQKHRVVILQTAHDWLEVALSDRDLEKQYEFGKILSERYKNVPGIRWDIQNEPSWSSYAPGPIPDINREWNAFLFERYGSEEKWKDAWQDQASGKFGSLRFDAKCGQNWDNVKAYDLKLFRMRLFRRWIDTNFRGLTQSRRYYVDVSGAEGCDQILWDNVDCMAIHFYDSWQVFPERLKYVDQRFRNTGFGVEEFGQKVHPAWGGSHPATPKTFPPAIDHFLALGHYTLGLGGYGLMNWDWKDMEGCIFPWGVNFPCDLVPKPTLVAFRNMSLLFRNLQPVYAEPELYFVIPDSHRLGAKAQNIEQAILNGLRFLIDCHIDFGVINEFNLSKLPGSAKVLIYPIPFCPDDTAYNCVRDFVKNGGILYISGDISYDELRRRTRTKRLEELCGVEFVEENYPDIGYSISSNAQEIGGSGLNTYTGYPCIKVKPKTARELRGSNGVIFVNSLAGGSTTSTGAKVFYTTDPYELHARGNNLYKFFLNWAGMKRNEISPDNPKIHFFKVPLMDGVCYVMFNADGTKESQEISFRHGNTDFSITLGKFKPGLVAITNKGKIRALETSGKIKAGNEVIADFTGLGMAFSLDNEDIRSSSAIVFMPIQAGRFALKCREDLSAEIGEVRSGRWQTYENIGAIYGTVAAGLQPALSISPDQTDCHFLLCPESERARCRQELEEFVALPNK